MMRADYQFVKGGKVIHEGHTVFEFFSTIYGIEAKLRRDAKKLGCKLYTVYEDYIKGQAACGIGHQLEIMSYQKSKGQDND